MVYKFVYKKTGFGVSVKEQLPEKLHKPVIKKLKERRVYARFKNYLGSCLLRISFKYLLYVTDVFTKYAWVKPLKDKKVKTVSNAFIETVNESIRKLNRFWIGQGREFHNKLMQDRFENNDTLMYCTHNKGGFVIAERFIKTLKAKIYKTITTNDRKFYLPFLNELVDRCNNTYHHYINWKSTNADYSALTEKIATKPKAPKFKVHDNVGSTKYKNIFGKGYTKNRWSRAISIIDCVLKTNPWTYKFKELNGEKIIGVFMKKNCCVVYYK